MKEVLKLALEALTYLYAETTAYEDDLIDKAIIAIKEALAQPEQEPVELATREYFYFELDRRVERIRKEMEIKTVTMRCKDYDVALTIIDMHFGHVFVGQVSTPPKRPWVGLTDEEIEDCMEMSIQKTCRAIEAALRSKNT